MGFSSGQGRRGCGGKSNAPVNFVSAGIQQSGKKKEEQEVTADQAVQAGSGSEDEEETMGFSVGNRARRNKKGKKSSLLRQDVGQIAGMRTSGFHGPMQLGKGFGDWEKHTKG